MFLFEDPEEYLRSQEVERQRSDRLRGLLRELRGSAPPFDGELTRRLTSAMADEAGSAVYRMGRPCPDAKEVMSA